MTIRETFVFINKPISAVVHGYRGKLTHMPSEDDREVAYLFGGSDPDTAEFGLAADLDAPGGRDWTQLLHSRPTDPEAVALALFKLKVKRHEIQPATDWEGASLVDLKPILGSLAAIARAASKPTARAATRKTDAKASHRG